MDLRGFHLLVSGGLPCFLDLGNYVYGKESVGRFIDQGQTSSWKKNGEGGSQLGTLLEG